MGTSRYTLNQTSVRELNCKLLYISHSKYENDWISVMHTHPFIEIFYVQGGCGEFLFEGEKYSIKKGNFIIINSNVPHTEKSFEDTPLEYITIGIEGVAFSFNGDKNYIVFEEKNELKDLLYYMTTILQEMMEKKTHYDNLCQNLLAVLLFKLERLTNYTMQIAPPVVQSTQECIRLKRYIESNFMHDITLDTLAKISNLNKHYLVHAFTKHYGCPPIQYLCQVRIQSSKELLANTDYTITEIAQSCGFSSQSYFAQSFYKNCGMTASAYRSSCKKKKDKK